MKPVVGRGVGWESYRQVGKIERILVTANATSENKICV
ncbi:hypothetical protein T11_5438 [Trichinella zimbabwensis]|uniref:Uncharacterized protein n=1 Tax=Trichinella zimbabwensis TaxID=268475 RepID=A0A0V1GMY9_9BILA|nr:hypothetical protein T11_14572 [Trichinella zimbabwensis]KRY99690.1 hypothetical protein T11_5438 [Trichinella zimbabwensis]